MLERTRVVSQDACGGPEVLHLIERPAPEPAAGEVVVRVHAAGVNPADWKTRDGLVTRFGPPPFTVGFEVSGVVERVGGGVGRFAPGEAVVGSVFPPHGGYAERVAVPVDFLAHKPARVDFIQAAALPVVGLTAWQALAAADVSRGQRVLVHAAAGGVGHVAVQLAKSRGAYVLGTAREANHAALRELGADELIDYTQVDFVHAADRVDVVLDPIGGEYGVRSAALLGSGGTLVDVRGTGPDVEPTRLAVCERGGRFIELRYGPDGAVLAHLLALVAERRLRVKIDRTFPLAAAADAHRLGETGHVAGKLVLTTDAG